MRRKYALLTRNDGSAVVEFAIVLGLILLSAAAAMLLLGAESERTFALLGDWDRNQRQSVSKISAGRTSDAAEPDNEALNDDATEHAAVPITIGQETLTAILAAVALWCYLMARQRRLRKQRAIAQLDEDRELVERIDNKRFLKRQEILKILAADPSALLENRVEVGQLMTTRLHTVRPKTTLDEMKAIIAEEHIRHFPVVTDKGILVGVVSDRELIGLEARTAADVMIRSLITVAPTTKIASALSQMVNRNISCLPVMEGDKLVGILTTTDAVMTLQCALQLWKRLGQTEEAARRQPAIA